MPGIPGEPTVANEYHYVGNDPLNFIDPLGLSRVDDGDMDLPVTKYLIDDTGPCPVCHADPSGSALKSHFLGLATTWNPAGYDDDAVNAAMAFGIDPRLVFSIFVQESNGSPTQGPAANTLQYAYCDIYHGPTCPATIGPTNLTSETLSHILAGSALTRNVLSSVSGGDYGTAEAVFWISQSTAGDGQQLFAATATAARLSYLQNRVRSIAEDEGIGTVSGVDAVAVTEIMTNTYSYWMTSMIGAGWNAQTGAKTVIGRLFQQDEPGTDPGTPDALKNLRTDGRGYVNQYTGSYCEASGLLGSYC